MTQIQITPLTPDDESASQLITSLDEYQLSLYPAESNHLDGLDELTRPNVFFVGAYLNGDLAGIAAVKKLDGYGEVKRLYVPPENRGHGLAKHLMAELESHLVSHGIFTARLETGVYQPEAIGLYECLGYRTISPFGDYSEDPLSVFMEKSLVRPAD